MVMTANRIWLSGEGVLKEAACGTALYPGHLVMLNSSGNVIPHNTEAGYAERAFALEDALQGNIVTTAYAVATGSTGASSWMGPDRVQYAILSPGAVVNAKLKAGYVYTVGGQVVSAGDGTLEPVASLSTTTVTVKQVIGILLAPLGSTSTTAIDLSATGAVATLSPIRVL